MATAVKITRDNFNINLKRSTEGREGGGTPDGNVFIDTTNDVLQLIDVTEAPKIDLGSGLEANPLTSVTKVQALALYFFLLQEVEADPSLQDFRVGMDAVVNRMGKLVGANAFLNGIKLADGTIDIAGVGGSLGDDRLKIADSGFTEFADGSGGNTLTDRILHGAKSSLPITTSNIKPFYMLVPKPVTEAGRQASIPVDFVNHSAINDNVQSFGSTANGDTGAGDFDYLDYEFILGVREYGFTMAETGSTATGVDELGAYVQGYAIGNSAVTAIQAIAEADVWDTQVAPYTGMGFFRFATGQTEAGFVEGDGTFTDYITNTGGGTLIELRAFMDKLMQQDTDQNDNTGSTGSYIPKRAEPLYTINSLGKLVTRQGLFIGNIPAENQLDIIFTDDGDIARTRPVVTPITIPLSDAWFSDYFDSFSSWLRLIYSDGAGALDFDTDSAVTVQDSDLIDVSGGATNLFIDMDINTILWQSATTVRITFNGTPDLSALVTNANAKINITGCSNASNNGKFVVTAFDDGADWIEIDNILRTDDTDDELTDATGVADLFNFDSRLFKVSDGWELRFSYAYDTNTQAGLVASADKPVILQVGGLNLSKSITKAYVIGNTAITFDGKTEAETN